jgi:hypothetical protein
MHQSDSRMHALIGLWILAGLMVVGVNGTMLLSLLDEPLAGYSSGVRNADRAFRQYRMRLTAEAEKITSGMERLTSWFTPGLWKKKNRYCKNRPLPPSLAKKMAPHPKVVLPTLTGIMTSRSSDGSTRRLALLDGRICAQGDHSKFHVKRIARGGVSLAGAIRFGF